MSDWRMDFAENLKYLRRVHGLTQVEMAKIVGVCVCTYRKMEHCDPRVRINSGCIPRICNHFQICPGEILDIRLEEANK